MAKSEKEKTGHQAELIKKFLGKIDELKLLVLNKALIAKSDNNILNYCISLTNTLIKIIRQ